MDYFFPRYLLSKQTVDDRALNKNVLGTLRASLPPQPVAVIEVGAGIGSMLRRLVEWEVICSGEYVLVDASARNIAYAQNWVPRWAASAGLTVSRIGPNQLQLCGYGRDLFIRFECADVFDFIKRNQQPADLLIAHAFLDLLPLPKSLEQLLRLTKSLAWLTINFDGVSTLLPEIEHALDRKIEGLYHSSMDGHANGGDSQTGRKLFDYLPKLPVEILAAGSSDWVVHANGGQYPADEKYFLHFILGFFADSLRGCPELNGTIFEDWLAKRHEQIERGELVYIAHQLDFLIRRGS